LVRQTCGKPFNATEIMGKATGTVPYAENFLKCTSRFYLLLVFPVKLSRELSLPLIFFFQPLLFHEQPSPSPAFD